MNDALIGTEPYGYNKIARNDLAESFQGEVFLPVTEEVGKPEHDEFRRLEYDATRGLLVPRVLPVLNWTEKFLSGLFQLMNKLTGVPFTNKTASGRIRSSYMVCYTVASLFSV